MSAEGWASRGPRLSRNLFAHTAEQRQWWLLPEPSLLLTGTALSPQVSRASPGEQAYLGRSQKKYKGIPQGRAAKPWELPGNEK